MEDSPCPNHLQKSEIPSMLLTSESCLIENEQRVTAEPTHVPVESSNEGDCHIRQI